MTSRNAKYGPLARGIRRDLSEKGWVPVRFWLIWWASLAVAMVAFYVVLTPIWLGLRAAAWAAELRSRLAAQVSCARRSVSDTDLRQVSFGSNVCRFVHNAGCRPFWVVRRRRERQAAERDRALAAVLTESGV